MFREAAEAPARLAQLLASDVSRYASLIERVRALRPRTVITCARGSSDHVATYARYLIETEIGILAASSPPSLNSLYQVERDLSQCLFIAISQSGESPDILASAQAAKAQGALVVALLNVEDSPLAGLADAVLPVRAGREASVAATKSFICSAGVMLRLISLWADNPILGGSLADLPDRLQAAWQLDWMPLVSLLKPARDLYVLGRGRGLGMADEAALKLKETCGLHAESFSSAEVRHGPIAIVNVKMPVLFFCQNDMSRPDMEALAGSMAGEGVPVVTAGGQAAGAIELPTLS